MFRARMLLTAACHPTLRTSIFPGRYVQGPRAIESLGDELARFGSSALVLVDPFVAQTMSKDIESALHGKVKFTLEVFAKECCDEEIARLAEVGKADVVVGLGGGKTIDTTKAVAHVLKKPVAIVPTLASSDAPCSALSVIYTTGGDFERYLVLPQNPNLVLVDTEVVVNAPVRFLVAGMGDALATWFEAESCFHTRSGNMTGFMGSYTALGLARMCYDTLREYGVAAKRACEAKTTCPALERVVEANILLSGLGFESGGIGAAHAIHNGLTSIAETHHFWHGEKVALGVVTSLFLTDRPPEVINTVYAFCESIGLPTTLADVGIVEVTPEKLLKIGTDACAKGETIHNEAGIMTPEAVAAALRAADAYGRARNSK